MVAQLTGSAHQRRLVGAAVDGAVVPPGRPRPRPCAFSWNVRRLL